MALRRSFGSNMREAIRALDARGKRSVLTVVGIGLAAALFVVAVGSAKSATHALLQDLARAGPTQVTLEVQFPSATELDIPWSSVARLESLDGVEAVGALAVNSEPHSAASLDLVDPLGPSGVRLDVVAATSGLLDALGGSVASGRFFDPLHDEEKYRVAVLGSAAAELLQFEWTDGLGAVTVDGNVYTVIGVLDARAATTVLGDALIVSAGAEPLDAGLSVLDVVHVRTKPGWARSTANAAAATFLPLSPDAVRTFLPTQSDSSTSIVIRGVDQLLASLSLIVAVFAIVGVSNVTLMNVVERRAEIGLKRALGATRMDITFEFFSYSALVGFAGGVFGLVAGLAGVALVSLWNGWTPVVAPWVVWAVPAMGLVAGCIAGIYPALRASRLEPAETLALD